MRILVCGDSWSEGYGIDPTKTWPIMLGHEIVNVASSGSSNDLIFKQFYKEYKNNFDIAIIGWSGVTRYHCGDMFVDFSGAEDYKLRNQFFKNKTINDFENDFLNFNNNVNKLCKKNNIKLIKFSVFGDFKYLWDQYYTDSSFLEFLSKKQGHEFKYDIPFFEFDFLSNVNFKNTSRFAKKYFKGDWKKAIIERNEIRPGEYFLPCGHPNEKGHAAWAEYIREYI